MTKNEMINWIENASYEELLRKWRSADVGSEWFLEEVGIFFSKKFLEYRKKLSTSELVETSKIVGW